MLIGLEGDFITDKRFHSGCGSSCANEQAYRLAVKAMLLELRQKGFECSWLVAEQRNQFFGTSVVEMNALAGQPRAFIETCLPRRQVRLAQQAARP